MPSGLALEAYSKQAATGARWAALGQIGSGAAAAVAAAPLAKQPCLLLWEYDWLFVYYGIFHTEHFALIILQASRSGRPRQQQQQPSGSSRPA